MGINRNELKRMIDHIHEEDAIEVYDFISNLNLKRENETLNEIDINSLSEDKELLRQIQKSREERKNGIVYNQEQGLKYLRDKIEVFERGQNL